MMQRIVMLSLLLMSCTLPLTTLAAEASYQVVVHSDNPITSLSAHEVQRLFLGKMKKWPGGGAVGLVINTTEPTHKQFTQQMLRKTPRQLSSYWRKALYSGRSMLPMHLADDQQVIDHIANHPQAVSVVSAAVNDPRIKQVTIQP